MAIFLRFFTSSTQLSESGCSSAARTKRFWNGVLLTVVDPTLVRSTFSTGLCKRPAGATHQASALAPCLSDLASHIWTANAPPDSISSNLMQVLRHLISVNGNRLDSLDLHLDRE